LTTIAGESHPANPVLRGRLEVIDVSTIRRAGMPASVAVVGNLIYLAD
jgi:hypothetical protein